MAMQMMVAIGLFTFAGFKLDKYLQFKACFIVIMPLLVIFTLLYKAINDTKIKK